MIPITVLPRASCRSFGADSLSPPFIEKCFLWVSNLNFEYLVTSQLLVINTNVKKKKNTDENAKKSKVPM